MKDEGHPSSLTRASIIDMHQPVIIGAGPNGLTSAFYLARAGMRPLVLEARDGVGGGANLAHTIPLLPPSVMRDMRLASRVELVRPEPRVIALHPDGPAVAFYTDENRTAEAIRRRSPRDGDRYAEFCAALQRIGAFAARLADMTPPSLDATSPGEFWDLLKAGRHFRSLGKKNAFRLLRWGPMAVADFVAEWFDDDLVQAVLAARGIFATAQGPWSAGTTAALLLGAAYDRVPAGSTVTANGGAAALTRAMRDAAREAGAEIRVAAPVARILVRDDAVHAVALEDGTEIPASPVISTLDPRRTFLALMDPLDLEPGFLSRVRNYRCRGCVAKVSLVLDSVPSFTGVEAHAFTGRIHIGPTIDYLERAFDASKYGRISTEPYLELSMQPAASGGSADQRGRHVMAVHVQYAPYHLSEPGNWDEGRRMLLDRVLSVLERYAPGIRSRVVHEEVLTPRDLEREYGLTGGHIFHGEQSLDQLFVTRPFLGCAQYRGPVSGLYLGGAGSHPGGAAPGAPGRNAAREVLKDLKAV